MLQNEDEQKYWDIYDTLTEKWDQLMREKEDYLLVPAANSRAHIDSPDGSETTKLSKLAADEKNRTAAAKDAAAPKAAIGNNSA